MLSEKIRRKRKVLKIKKISIKNKKITINLKCKEESSIII